MSAGDDTAPPAGMAEIVSSAVARWIEQGRSADGTPTTDEGTR